jgi:hypothetical protein
MRAQLCCVALAVALLPVAAMAQDGLRSASLPDRNVSPTRQSMPEDVFRATPDTYRPRPDRTALPIVYGFQGPFPYPTAPQVIVIQVPRESVEAARGPLPAAPTPAPYVAGTPGRPKTFYLIPGCYAGDRRPDPESLRPGCSAARLRVVPPAS